MWRPDTSIEQVIGVILAHGATDVAAKGERRGVLASG
jgi:hypothetical protein